MRDWKSKTRENVGINVQEFKEENVQDWNCGNGVNYSFAVSSVVKGNGLRYTALMHPSSNVVQVHRPCMYMF